MAGALRATGDEWFPALDALYLRHRMQRWAGATETAVAHRRTVLNPMLDPGFLEIAERLAPADKARSRFLARLQVELDPDLARVPLEGRPPPERYARGGTVGAVSFAANAGRKAARKAAQRLLRRPRPPAGGTALAERVVAHWRRHPGVLDRVARSGLVRGEWLDRVVAAAADPQASSVAFLVNLDTALAAISPSPDDLVQMRRFSRHEGSLTPPGLLLQTTSPWNGGDPSSGMSGPRPPSGS